jgi:acylphosphatase
VGGCTSFVIRARLVFRGRVQGVGFRFFVLREAERLGVAGRVANRPDGSVEAEGEAAREVLERWIAAIRGGPSHAEVRDVSVEWSEGPARHRGFQVGPQGWA